MQQKPTRWQRQILRVESTKKGQIHTSQNTTRQRTNAYGRIPIIARYDDTCQAIRLGVVCGNPIQKGRRAYWEPTQRKIECRDCWT